MNFRNTVIAIMAGLSLCACGGESVTIDSVKLQQAVKQIIFNGIVSENNKNIDSSIFIIDYQIKLSILNIFKLEDDSFNVEIEEERVCYYKIGGPPMMGRYMHEFKVVREYNDNLKVGFINDGSKLKPVAPKRVIDDIAQSHPYQIKKEADNGVSSKSFALSYSYNREYASWYGWYYAYSSNPSFITYSKDCTNFISQALWYGGWSMAGGYPINWPTSYWWYSFTYTKNSETWSIANKWNQFFNSSGRGYRLYNYCALLKGDIVQADWNSDGYIDHSMIVTYKNNCDIRVSYHSTNTRDRSLSELLNSYPATTFYFLKIYDY